MEKPVEKRCLSPLAWRVGFLKGIVLFTAIGGTMLLFQGHASGGNITLSPVFGILAVLIGLYFWPSKVSLLEDGLAYKRYGVTKFIPYSKIRSAQSIQRLGGG